MFMLFKMPGLIVVYVVNINMHFSSGILLLLMFYCSELDSGLRHALKLGSSSWYIYILDEPLEIQM